MWPGSLTLLLLVQLLAFKGATASGNATFQMLVNASQTSADRYNNQNTTISGTPNPTTTPQLMKRANKSCKPRNAGTISQLPVGIPLPDGSPTNSSASVQGNNLGQLPGNLNKTDADLQQNGPAHPVTQVGNTTSGQQLPTNQQGNLTGQQTPASQQNNQATPPQANTTNITSKIPVSGQQFQGDGMETHLAITKKNCFSLLCWLLNYCELEGSYNPFNGATGACGFPISDADPVVAVDTSVFDQYQ